MRERASIFNTTGPFNLVHGDMNGGNIIIEDSEKAFLIDFDNMYYGHCAPELVRCLNYCQESLSKQQLFLDTYRQNVSKESWQFWQENMVTIVIFSILKIMSVCLKKSKKLEKKGLTQKGHIKFAYSQDLWIWLQNIMIAFPDGRGDWPSIIELFTLKNKEQARHDYRFSL